MAWVNQYRKLAAESPAEFKSERRMHYIAVRKP